MTSFECQAVGNRCDYCVGLAQVAFANMYQETHPGMPTNEIAMITENSGLSARIEDQSGLEALRCDARQKLARTIGARLGATKK